MQHHSLIIVGGGPAACTAALYAARADLHPVVFEGLYSGPPGGQLMTTTDVENFPGFPDGVLGPDLMELFRSQAKRFGALFVTEDVTDIDTTHRPFIVTSASGKQVSEAIIIATGARAKRLQVPGTSDEEFWQKGVTACAVCDGALPLFRNQPLFVIGGGDSAIEEALFLTRFGSKVFIVHRRERLRASKIMEERALLHPKIEILWNHVLVRVEGDTIVRRVVLEQVHTQTRTTHLAGGLFFAIGHEPNVAFLRGQLALADNGYIQTFHNTTATSVEGIFAAGDVQDWVYRQAITAAGSGCMSALDAERWLAAHPSSKPPT